LILLDWDDAGPACPDQELAGLLAFWHVHDDGRAHDAAAGRTLAAYRSAGGPGQLREERSFSMYIASRMNFLHSQASVALEPGHRPRAPAVRRQRDLGHARPAALAVPDQRPDQPRQDSPRLSHPVRPRISPDPQKRTTW